MTDNSVPEMKPELEKMSSSENQEGLSGARVRNVKDEKVDQLAEDLGSLAISGTSALPAVSVIDSLDAFEKEAVEDLKGLQDKYKELSDCFEKELKVLKAKYDKLYRPLYDQRADRLLQCKNPGGDNFGTVGLPSFWYKSLKNSNTLSEMIEPKDIPILAYLENVSSEWLDESDQNLGFKLVFKFSPNPFFSPSVLEKEYNMSAPDTDTQPVLNSTTSTPITWKDGKNPTRERVERKQRNKRTKQTRTVTEDVETESFFNFFCSQELPSEQELDEMPDQDVSDLELMIEADYEMGIMIRDKIIPQAVRWFLGEVIDDDEDFDEDYDEEEGGDEDEESLSDEDEDDSDEDKPVAVRGGQRKGLKK